MSDVNSEWVTAVSDCLKSGSIEVPRGLAVRERLCKTTTVDMSRPVLTIKSRRLSYKFMAAEAAWILSGDNRLAPLLPYNKRMASYSDDGVHLSGAYGPMVVEQLPYVVRCLESDPSSRQAVMTVWRPRPGASKDVPCTVSLQFLVRGGRLHVVDTMRSSDLWLGWPYDVFSMSMIALRVSQLLKHHPPLGQLHLTAGSSHVYESDIEAVRRVLFDVDDSWSPRTVSDDVDLVEWLWARAEDGGLVS